MTGLNKAGGIAALVLALAYVAGFAVMVALLDPGDTQGWSLARKLDFVLAHRDLFQAWTIFVYVVAGLALVVLAVALHERLGAAAHAAMPVATAIGLVWAGLVIASGMVAIVGLEAVARLHATDGAQAVSAWVAIGIVHDGLGGGIEIVGGAWMLLVSLVSLQSRALPRALGWLGLFVGVVGLLTVVPAWAGLVDLFGLSQILWFAGLGVSLLRRAPG